MGNKQIAKATHIEFSKQQLILIKQQYNQDIDDCLICLELIVNPVQCQTCKSIYCKMCALKWRQSHAKCPKKCSEQWKIIQIKSKNIQLRCPYDTKCPEISFPQTIQNHLESCTYAPSNIKTLVKLKKQYLCKKSHPLTFLSKQNSSMNFQKLICAQCCEIKICRSECITCEQYYCIKCRVPTSHRTICPKKTHRYEYIINQNIICDICGTKPSYLDKGCFNDKYCDFAICQNCYSKFQRLQNEEKFLAQILKNEKNEANQKQVNKNLHQNKPANGKSQTQLLMQALNQRTRLFKQISQNLNMNYKD